MTRPPNPLVQMSEFIRDDSLDKLFRANVVAFGTNELFIRRDGSIETEGPYPVMEGITAGVGDEVVVGRIGTGYIVLGRILRSSLTPHSSLGFVEVNSQQTTTNVALQDIPGLTLNMTLYRPAMLAAVLTFDAELSSGAGSVLAVAINMHGGDHAEHQQSLSVASDHHVGAVAHAHDDPFDPGVHTIKGRFRRVSGTGTVAIDRCALLVWALPA